MAKKKSATDYKQYAQDYGFQLAFLKSDPELYKIFKQAVDSNPPWDVRKFQAAIQNSKWYKTHGETYRQTLALQKTDPATYNARLASLVAQVRDKATALGATLSYDQTVNLAKHSMFFGWNENQLANTLSQYIMYGSARGQAASNLAEMQNIAWRNGIRYSAHSYRAYARRMAAGEMTIDDFKKQVRNQAATLAPAYADQIQGGADLYDVASPYMQSMAQTLELNPADIDLFDPTIRKALSTKDKEGKPTSMSLSDFEISLRNDQRYMKTQQAQDSAMAVGHKVLQDMGLLS